MSATYEIDRETGVTWHSGRSKDGDHACISHESWSTQASQPDITANIQQDIIHIELECDHASEHVTIPLCFGRRLAEWILDHAPGDSATSQERERVVRLQAEAWQQGHDAGRIDTLLHQTTPNTYKATLGSMSINTIIREDTK